MMMTVHLMHRVHLSTCPNFDLGTLTGDGLVTGTLAGATQDQFQASCTSQGTSDLLFAWEATQTGCATVDTLSGTMDSILVAFDGCPSSGGTEIPEHVTMILLFHQESTSLRFPSM